MSSWNPFAKASAPLVQDGERSFEQPLMPNSESTGSSWTAPFKKFGEAVSAPFKQSTPAQSAHVKPPENDPIALATKVSPPNAGLYVSMAKMQERSGNTAAAVEEYDKALDVDPKNIQALLGLARLYDRQGRYDEAIKFYRDAVTTHDDNAAAHNDFGLCLARSGKMSEAAVELRRAVDLDSQKVLYRNNLATVLVELNRADEALKALVAAHGEAVAHYNVGFLLNKRDRKSEALQHFSAAARLDPNFKEARQWVELLSGKTGEAKPTEESPKTAAAATPAETASKPAAVVEPIASPFPALGQSPVTVRAPIVAAAPPADPKATRPAAPTPVASELPEVPRSTPTSAVPMPPLPEQVSRLVPSPDGAAKTSVGGPASSETAPAATAHYPASRY